MYPGKKKEPLPQFTPPPIPPSLFGQAQNIWGPEQRGIIHFQQVGPQFSSDIFEGEVYPTCMKPSTQLINQQPTQNSYQQQQQQQPQKIGEQRQPIQPNHLMPPQNQPYPMNGAQQPHVQPTYPMNGAQQPTVQQPYPMNGAQQPSGQSLNFSSDVFNGKVYPSTHIRR
jgi:hypothetical protein